MKHKWNRKGGSEGGKEVYREREREREVYTCKLERKGGGERGET